MEKITRKLFTEALTNNTSIFLFSQTKALKGVDTDAALTDIIIKSVDDVKAGKIGKSRKVIKASSSYLEFDDSSKLDIKSKADNYKFSHSGIDFYIRKMIVDCTEFDIIKYMIYAV